MDLASESAEDRERDPNLNCRGCEILEQVIDERDQLLAKVREYELRERFTGSLRDRPAGPLASTEKREGEVGR